MLETNTETVDTDAIKKILHRHKEKAKLALQVCAHCSLCAESCFLFTTRGRKPEYMPSYKMIHTVGRLLKQKGRVDRACLEEMRDLLWENCVLCTRCYCPLGIDIPEMITLGRRVCRSQNVLPQYGVISDDNHLNDEYRPENPASEKKRSDCRPAKAA